MGRRGTRKRRRGLLPRQTSCRLGISERLRSRRCCSSYHIGGRLWKRQRGPRPLCRAAGGRGHHAGLGGLLDARRLAIVYIATGYTVCWRTFSNGGGGAIYYYFIFSLILRCQYPQTRARIRTIAGKRARRRLMARAFGSRQHKVMNKKQKKRFYR